MGGGERVLPGVGGGGGGEQVLPGAGWGGTAVWCGLSMLPGVSTPGPCSSNDLGEKRIALPWLNNLRTLIKVRRKCRQ